MKKYFLTQTGEEVVVGKPLKLSALKDNTKISVETSAVNEAVIEFLESHGLITVKEESVLDADKLIPNIAKRFSLKVSDVNNMCGFLQHVSPKLLFELLLRECSLELDKSYENSIYKGDDWVGNVWFISSVDGTINAADIEEMPERDRANITLFRSRKDAELAVKTLKGVYDQLYG